MLRLNYSNCPVLKVSCEEDIEPEEQPMRFILPQLPLLHTLQTGVNLWKPLLKLKKRKH